MKNILLSTLFVGSSLLVSAQKKQVVQAATPPANYLQLVKEITPQLTTWRRHFHENPELSNREFNTGKYIANYMRSIGYEVKEKQSEALIAGTHALGSGKVIYLIDNPLFRSFWERGKLLFSNAIYF